MLKKIIKHDSLAILRRLLPLFIAQLAAGVLLTGLMTLLTLPYHVVLVGLVSTLAALLWVSMLVLLPVELLLIYHRYYHTLFTDEGYLTMVIPESEHRLLIGNLLAGLIWTVTATAITLLSSLLGLLPMLLRWIPTGNMLGLLLEGVGEMATELVGIGWRVPLHVLTGLLILLYEHLLVYYAITLGGTFFRKHKYVGAILFYYLIHMLVSTVTNLSSLLLALPMQPLLGEVLSSLLAALLYGGATAALYFLTHSILHRRFNLD